MCHVRRRFCKLRTGVLQDSMVGRTLVPWCRIQSSGAGVVFGELLLARRLVFPAIAWRQSHFQPARIKCQRMRVRQAVVFSLPHLPSRPSLHLDYHPHTHSLRLFVLCLCHSLRLYIAYLLRFLPSSIAAASAINQQSIAPPRCVTPPPSNVLPRSKASRYASRVTSQVSSRYLRRRSRSSATLRGAVVSNIPTRHLNTNATTTLDV